MGWIDKRSNRAELSPVCPQLKYRKEHSRKHTRTNSESVPYHIARQMPMFPSSCGRRLTSHDTYELHDTSILNQESVLEKEYKIRINHFMPRWVMTDIDLTHVVCACCVSRGSTLVYKLEANRH